MKSTAIAPANIAFIKYWGKADEKLRLPLNSSISMNLSGAYTTTTVEFSSKYTDDIVELIDGNFSEKEKERVIEHLDRIRAKANSTDRAYVVTQNTFPKGTGIAASASGFAALTLAASNAASLKLSEKELTILARLGSGSACRSIPDGFVMWEKGTDADSSYAHSLYPHDYWDLRDILAIVSSTMKKIPTNVGMENIQTSPFLSKRLNQVPKRIELCKKALQTKDFHLLGQIIEEDCLDMHHIMQTQKPPLYYWSDTTVLIMDAVKFWRRNSLAVYFTIDAGPNVHLICEGKDESAVLEKLQKLHGIESIIVNKPAQGARIIK